MSKYYVSEWALLRKAELIESPEDYEIHSDYLKILGKEKIILAVKSIRQMFMNIYQDIADYPERFKMPMIEIRDDERTKTGAPPAKALPSKTAPFMFFDALINVLISGIIANGELIIDNPEKLKNENEVCETFGKIYSLKNIDKLYSQFEHYGLYLEGLKNFKFTQDTGCITLSYPGDSDLLVVLKWMADKAGKFNCRHDFMQCHYRLLQDEMNLLNYGKGIDYVADRLHSKEEQDCAYKLDEALREAGFISRIDHTTEYSLVYFRNEKEKEKHDNNSVKINSNNMKLNMRIRTRNIQNGVEHIKQCSCEVKGFFIPGDKGCEGHAECEEKFYNGKGSILSGGQGYIIDGVKYWKCGICMGSGGGKFITLQPKIEEIPDYVKLAELCY
jgi:hypothetical protein